MAECIDRQAAYDAIKKEWDGCAGQYEAWQIILDTCAAIDELPPADVRPVVPGKWEVVDWVEYDGHGECVHYPKEGLCCTNCKNVFKKKLLWKDNYCPNCGAANSKEVMPNERTV